MPGSGGACPQAVRGPARPRRSAGTQQQPARARAQTNARGLRLECCQFRPAEEGTEALPVVVYCHCNSGSRRDAEEAVLALLPHRIAVFALDFAVRPQRLGFLVGLGLGQALGMLVITRG